jgi:hypothetical protein
MVRIDKEIALNFRDQLREARAAALRDAEGFQDILFVLERLGSQLLGKIGDLDQYKPKIEELAEQSHMASQISFKAKYEIVRKARNSAFHQGAVARHLTVNASELSLVLEEALMSKYDQVGDFMVRNPVCAYLWQPLGFIRQIMLVNSFSYLPVSVDEEGAMAWRLIADFKLARYLRGATGDESKKRLVQTLKEAVDSGKVELLPTKTFLPNDSIQTALQEPEGLPVLVLYPENKQLIGILTPFDLL